MKLILSRKGFDSSPTCGGCASPILPDGRMVSLPIPHASGTVTFADLRPRGVDVGKLVCDLAGNSVKTRARAHLDPDLDPTTLARPPGWRPAFGQDSTAQRHLGRMGVGVGDTFLFFGWFRRVALVEGRYRYEKGAPDLHVLFGWLRVGQVLRVGPDPVPEWLRDHPHAVRDGAPHNTIYVADGPEGASVFPFFRSALQLTEPGSSTRSRWRLPTDFFPNGRTPLSYHGSAARWTAGDDCCALQSVAKGQEFVLDLDGYAGVREWAGEILAPCVPT